MADFTARDNLPVFNGRPLAEVYDLLPKISSAMATVNQTYTLLWERFDDVFDLEDDRYNGPPSRISGPAYKIEPVYSRNRSDFPTFPKDHALFQQNASVVGKFRTFVDLDNPKMVTGNEALREFHRMMGRPAAAPFRLGMQFYSRAKVEDRIFKVKITYRIQDIELHSISPEVQRINEAALKDVDKNLFPGMGNTNVREMLSGARQKNPTLPHGGGRSRTRRSALQRKMHKSSRRRRRT